MPGDEKAMELRTLSVSVETCEVEASPSLTFFRVALEMEPEGQDMGGVWEETFGSRAELEAFLRGVRAGNSFGHCFIGSFEISTQPSVIFSRKSQEEEDVR